jgi:hypothetical protein
MTQYEIIALAKQVGFPIQHPDWQKAVEEFAALVEAKSAANEREACAKVVQIHLEASDDLRTKGTLASVLDYIKFRGKQA